MSPEQSIELLSRAVLVTGNPGKAREIRRILGIEIEHAPLDLAEIQELEIETILRAKGEEARRRLGRPVVVDETSLELAALNGFPGPLVKWLLQAVGPAGIARLTEGLDDARVVARCSVLYCAPTLSVIAEGSTRGRIVEPRGSAGFGWDSVFLPHGESGTYAEIDAVRKDRIGHRGKALRNLVERLSSAGDREHQEP